MKKYAQSLLAWLASRNFPALRCSRMFNTLRCDARKITALASRQRLFAYFLGALLLAASTAQAAELKRLPQDMRPCVDADMQGLRKLRNVLETTVGPGTAAFNNAPHQYIFFRKNQTFATVSGSVFYPGPKPLNEALRTAFKNNMHQYVLGESGALYYYKDGKATDAYTCRVVTKPQGNYRQGDMLLITSKAGSKEATVRLYFRPTFQQPGAQPKPGAKPAPKPAPKKK